jgi:hypothetical protein
MERHFLRESAFVIATLASVAFLASQGGTVASTSLASPIRSSRPSARRAHRLAMVVRSISRERHRAPGENATCQPISAGAACRRGEPA